MQVLAILRLVDPGTIRGGYISAILGVVLIITSFVLYRIARKAEDRGDFRYGPLIGAAYIAIGVGTLFILVGAWIVLS